MEILNFQEKGKYLNTLEKFHIYKANKTGILLNDNFTNIFNPISDLID
jgi:hypothetical protein